MTVSPHPRSCQPAHLGHGTHIMDQDEAGPCLSGPAAGHLASDPSVARPGDIRTEPGPAS
eukprot:757889-Hanusia_phi.AAC.3